MEQIIIIDDVLPVEMAKSLEELTKSMSFPWFIQRDIYKSKLVDEEEHRAAPDKNTVNTIQLGHIVYDMNKTPKENSTVWSLCEKALEHIAEKLPEHFVSIIPIRSKFNLLLNNTNCLQSPKKYNTPHVDSRWWDSYSMVYYVNSADGDTVIFNEEDGPDAPERPQDLTIKQRITPVQNRIVLFKGTHYHTSSNPIKSEHRIVMNTTFHNKTWSEGIIHG